MKINTVVLSLNDYNQLREFKEKIEEGYTYVSPQPDYYSGILQYQPVKYITTDTALDELKEQNRKLSEINGKLINELNELKNSNQFDVRKIVKMSIWEFIKWRKQQ